MAHKYHSIKLLLAFQSIRVTKMKILGWVRGVEHFCVRKGGKRGSLETSCLDFKLVNVKIK